MAPTTSRPLNQGTSAQEWLNGQRRTKSPTPTVPRRKRNQDVLFEMLRSFNKFDKQASWEFVDLTVDFIIDGICDAGNAALGYIPEPVKDATELRLWEVFEERTLRQTIPLFMVGTIIGMQYFGFAYVYLPNMGLSFLSSTSLTFHSLLGLTIVSYYKAVVIDPGTIPDSWTNLPHIAGRFIEKKKSSGCYRWCQKENKYKPDRAHFCSAMNRNVLRMDHYCPWLVNCVGFYNYKYFFLFLLYTTVTSNFVTCSLGHLMLQGYMNAGHTFFGWEIFGLSTVLTTVITPFFLFHCRLISKNMTTIEYCESRRDHTNGDSPYDINLLRNIKSALGSNPLYWLLPVETESTHDGLVYEINDAVVVTERDPENTSTALAATCWDELFNDVHEFCNEINNVANDAVERFRYCFFGPSALLVE